LVPAFAFKICVFLDLLFSRAGRDLARLEVCSFEVLFGVQQQSQRVWPGHSPALNSFDHRGLRGIAFAVSVIASFSIGTRLDREVR
jgi:hypothetical protein